ncbi:YpjP family protein [Bacillus suaedae]|nr:YpjP family protein [Bacillus suaedae]
MKGRIKMLPWMKRGLIISSAILSFGLATTTPDLDQAVLAQQPNKSQDELDGKSVIYKVNQDNYDLFTDVLPAKAGHYIHRHSSSAELLNAYFIDQAYEQSLIKFGPSISDKIVEPFNDLILPQLDKVVRETTNTLSNEDWKFLKTSVSPSAGNGEKILHLYNEESGEDIFRFHVRRDQPPKQGYFFNFHYHTYLDHYETHHELGSIYWGKDMPPQWSSESNLFRV